MKRIHGVIIEQLVTMNALGCRDDDVIAAVRANGVPVEYVVFDDEGHGFTKSANRIAALTHYLDFLAAHLDGG